MELDFFFGVESTDLFFFEHLLFGYYIVIFLYILARKDW
jgi:hypothetical protein